MKHNCGVKPPYYMLIPAILMFAVFFIYPALQTLYFSFTNFNGINPVYKMIGFENYMRIATESDFGIVAKNTFYFAFLNVFLQSVFGLILAVFLKESTVRNSVYRTIFYLPAVLSTVAISFVFSFIYNPSIGVLNSFLEHVGLGFMKNDWLGNPKLAIFSVIVTTVWQSTGYVMLIYLAGLQGIPQDLYEAAIIDGANPFQKFKAITIPMLAPSITVAVVVGTITNIREFGRIYIMTNGGPGISTQVMVTYLYRAFGKNQFGYASAMAIVLLIILAILAVIQLTILRKREEVIND